MVAGSSIPDQPVPLQLSQDYLQKLSRQTQTAPHGWRRLCLSGLRHAQFPYLFLSRSLTGLLLSLNWWDVMDESLLLGGAPMFDDIERLQRQGVQAVVNLSEERPDDQQRLDAARMDYLWLPVRDTTPPTVAQVVHGLIWLEQRLNAGQMIYIHCTAGRGRSATFLACWYMYAEGMSVSQVLRFIKSRRPQTALTRSQRRRLEEFATLLPSTV